MKSVYILFIGLIVQCHGQHLGCEDIPPEPHCTTLYKNINKVHHIDRRGEFLQLMDYLEQLKNVTEEFLGPYPSLLDGHESIVQWFHNMILLSNNSQIVHLTKNVCRLVLAVGGLGEQLKMYNSTNCTMPTKFSWPFSDKANTAIINTGVVECIEVSNVLQDIRVHNALHCDAWKNDRRIEQGDVQIE